MSATRRLSHLSPTHRAARHGRPFGPDRSRERGGTLLLVTLLVVPLLIITALVVDVGYAKQQRRQIQAGADAAALAAAQELNGQGSVTAQMGRAVTEAKRWAGRNVDGLTEARWASCQDSGRPTGFQPLSGQTPCVTFDSLTDPTRVRVRLPDETQPQFFGQLATDAMRVSASAIAQVTRSSPATTGDCGLCSRDSMQLDGRQNIQIIGGGTIHTRSMTANWDAGTSTISPCPVKVVTGNNRGPCPGTSTQPFDRVPAPPEDPFADRPPPPTNIPPCNTINNNQTCNINNANDFRRFVQPNILITQGFTIRNAGVIELEPGNYFFADRFEIGDNTTIRSKPGGVTLFFVCGGGPQGRSRPCNPGERGGSLEGNGNNITFDITAPSSGDYANIAVYFDRNNTQGTAPKFQGDNSTYKFVGSIYAYSGKFTGTGSRVLDVTGRIFVQYWEQNSMTGSTIVRFNGSGGQTGDGEVSISLVG